VRRLLPSARHRRRRLARCATRRVVGGSVAQAPLAGRVDGAVDDQVSAGARPGVGSSSIPEHLDGSLGTRQIGQVPNEASESSLDAAGSWAKKYFLASRALMDAVLRPYDLGNTQWYVLHLLATEGAIGQRDLTRLLEVERATLSTIVSTLVRKGLTEQLPDPHDQRQKVLQITASGRDLWNRVPNPIALITDVAFDGVDDADVVTAHRVLRDATQRLNDYRYERSRS
jgi:DNA-binding MarR family transcriptional regulator